VLWAEEWNTTAEGTQKEVWAHRSQVLLLGRVRGGGADHHRNLSVSALAHRGQGASGSPMGGEKPLAQATGDRVLLVQAMGSWETLLWAKGSGGGGVSTMWCLLCDVQAAGMDHFSCLRGQREEWPQRPANGLHQWLQLPQE